jgi:hypothetical protein
VINGSPLYYAMRLASSTLNPRVHKRAHAIDQLTGDLAMTTTDRHDPEKGTPTTTGFPWQFRLIAAVIVGGVLMLIGKTLGLL